MQNMSDTQNIYTLSNGLIIEDIIVGTGNEVQQGDTIKAHYTGTLENGDLFDTSKGRGKFTTKIGVGMVIPGWDIGIPALTVGETKILGLKEGGKRKLTIPAALAYGDNDLPGIPAGSTLIFEIEDVEILK